MNRKQQIQQLKKSLFIFFSFVLLFFFLMTASDLAKPYVTFEVNLHEKTITSPSFRPYFCDGHPQIGLTFKDLKNTRGAHKACPLGLNDPRDCKHFKLNSPEQLHWVIKLYSNDEVVVKNHPNPEYPNSIQNSTELGVIKIDAWKKYYVELRPSQSLKHLMPYDPYFYIGTNFKSYSACQSRFIWLQLLAFVLVIVSGIQFLRRLFV